MDRLTPSQPSQTVTVTSRDGGSEGRHIPSHPPIGCDGVTPAEMADSLGFLALSDRPTLEGECDACDGAKARLVVRDVPGEALALLVYQPDASVPVVVPMMPSRALAVAAQLIDAARRRLATENR